MSKVVDITTIFPQRHPLILVSAIVLVADTMRIPDEESSNLLLNTEIDHLAGGLVPHVTDTAFSTTTLLVFGALQLLPSARIVLASGLLFRKLTQVLAPLPFEGADPSPSHDHGHCCVGGDSRQVDFPQIDGGLHRAWSFFCLLLFDTDMQLKAIVPNQATCTTVFRQVERQDQGRAPLAHWQHHTPTLTRDGLSRPFDWIEAFGAPGVFHLHLRMTLTQFARGLNGGKKSGKHLLNRLAVQGKPAPGSLVQCIPPRPSGMSHTRSFVHFHTHVPYLRRLHLSSFTALELLIGQSIQLVDFYRFHGRMIS